jgi:hypothetical protein
MQHYVPIPLGRLAALVAIAASTHQASARSGPLEPIDAILPVTGVEIRLDLERGEVVTGIRTPFGVAHVRQPEFVARKFNWDNQRADIRAPRAIYDLDFGTVVASNPEQAEPVEAAILLNSGSARLNPGPDAFVFLRADTVTGIRVAPLLRDNAGRLFMGAEVELDTARDIAPVSVGEHQRYGFGVDLDMWIQRDALPAHARVMGLVVIHDGAPGTGALEISEIIASESPLFSQGPGGGGGGGFSEAFSIGGAGFRGSGSGGGGPAPDPFDDDDDDDPDDDDETEVPSPGAGLLLGLGIAAAAARRRR